MRFYCLIFMYLLISLTIAEPDPKKYKPEKEEKGKQSSNLTKDERKFLREVEEKFGIKSNMPVESENENNEKSNSTATKPKPLFPAVIAIEIFNDTDSKSKGKRTIDASLGYGYRTNNGYKYAYFGKSGQDKGKFMIYPYSQEDIPSTSNLHGSKYSAPSNSQTSSQTTSVEIQPSQAFELVEVNNQENGYDYKIPSNPLKTKYEDIETEKPSQTLYTTYNGQEFSGLSGQFPSVMPSYFMDPTQLLKNTQSQNIGQTQDHLRYQNSYVNQHQRVVPVLVLRVPSSYLKNPTAELYADLPKNYPLSHYLNTVNLQELVNQYFKKSGYSFAPRIMTYQNSPLTGSSVESTHYANHYASPTYSQAGYSGIQYSAIKPTIAKYPSSYASQEYISQSQAAYESPAQPQYQYKYVYEPQSEGKAQRYYDQSQYISQSNSEGTVYQSEQTVEHQADPQDSSLSYAAPQQSNDQESKLANDYAALNSLQNTPAPEIQYTSAAPETIQYENVQDESYLKQTPSTEYGPVKVSLPRYNSASQYQSSQPEQKETISVYPSQLIHSENYQQNPSSNSKEYSYQSQSTDISNSGSILSESYPTKDHTIANAYSYESVKNPQTSIQTVSYVTPAPNSKYQSHYQVMVPQTILTNPSSLQTSSQGSHLSGMHYLKQHYYNLGHNAPQNRRPAYSGYSAGKTRPQTYYTYSKRMAKPDSKIVSKTIVRKQNLKKSSM